MKTKMAYLILLMILLPLTIPSSSGSIVRPTDQVWWQVGDFYIYQDINDSSTDIQYYLAEETTFNGEPVFNVTSTTGERLGAMWHEIYHENYYHSIDSFSLLGSLINISIDTHPLFLSYSFEEETTYLEYSNFNNYFEGVNHWKIRSYSKTWYHHSYDPRDPHTRAEFHVYVEKESTVNSSIFIESDTILVPAGEFNCWKIEYFSPMSTFSPLAQNRSETYNMSGYNIDNSIFYEYNIKNSTRINDTSTAYEYRLDDNGTIYSWASEVTNYIKQVVYLDKYLGIIIKSIDYSWNDTQSKWLFSHGTELGFLHVTEKPQGSTDSIETTISDESKTASVSTPFLSALMILTVLFYLYYLQRGKKNKK